MKILMLSSGGNPHTIKWVRSLAEKGFEIYIFSLDSFDPALYVRFPNVKFHIANMDKSIKSGVGSFSKLNYLKSLSTLKKIIKSFKPDILHAHFASSYGLIGALSGFQPFYMSVWGADVYDFPVKSFLHTQILKFNLRRSARIFSTSHVMADETRKYTSKDIQVIPFGIDLNKFSPSKLEKKENTIVVGTIKTLEEKYGIEYLVRAFAEVKKDLPDIDLKLLIVGKGSKLAELQALAESLNIADLTTFQGWVPVEQIPYFQNQLDIAVFPSILDSESFGVAVIEASACEVPVIVSNKGGLVEVVNDEETGLVFKAKDVHALKDAIKRLVLDQALRERLGSQGRKLVSEKYDWNKNLDSMINAYRSLP